MKSPDCSAEEVLDCSEQWGGITVFSGVERDASWWECRGRSLTSWRMRRMRPLSDETCRLEKDFAAVQIEMREWTRKVASKPTTECEALGRWCCQMLAFSLWETRWIWAPVIEGWVECVCECVCTCTRSCSRGSSTLATQSVQGLCTSNITRILQLKWEVRASNRFGISKCVIFENMELGESLRGNTEQEWGSLG